MWCSVIAMTQWYAEGLRYYGHAGFNAAKKRWQDPNMTKQLDLSGKHYVVTGANAGLGYAIAHELAKRKATVHMVCRDAGRGEDARKSSSPRSGRKKPNTPASSSTRCILDGLSHQVSRVRLKASPSVTAG